MRLLLTASNIRYCIDCNLYMPYPAIVDVCGLSKEISAALDLASDQRNTI